MIQVKHSNVSKAMHAGNVSPSLLVFLFCSLFNSFFGIYIKAVDIDQHVLAECCFNVLHITRKKKQEKSQ